MKRAAICNSQGFSLVELIVVMAMFLIIIAVTGDTFSRIMTRSSVQLKGAASNIEGIVGLEMMRKDLASVGFGLSWSFDSAAITYNEVDPGAAGSREAIAAAYNVTPNTEAQTEVPMAVSGGNNIDLTPDAPSKLIDGTDYLVIRATSIGSSQASQRWSFMNYTSMSKPGSLAPESWTRENLAPDDWVVVLRVGLATSFTKELVTDGGSITTQFDNLAQFEPEETKVTHYIYGVSTGSQPRMPFNRADYYVRIPVSTEDNRLPQRCAPNTGILYKALVDHASGSVSSPGSELPLLDCVADLQVVYVLDSSSNGQITETDSLAGLTTREIRDQLKSIQVYVLSHEGGKDLLYTYPNQTIGVGPTVDGLTSGTGRTFNLSTTIGTGWERYRWKIYRFTVNPLNLGSAL